MEGGNGGGESCWSYRGETGSDVSTVHSSRSGTIVSSAYTSSTSTSCNSTIVSAEKATMLFDLEIYGDVGGPREDAEEDIGSLVQEFFVGVSSVADCSTNGSDMSVLDRWFTELGVGWVLHLHLTDGASGIPKLTSAHAQIWIRALGKIMKTIRRYSASLLARRRRISMGVGLAVICEEEEEAESCCIVDQFQLLRFIKETMLRMVAFVDVIVDLNRNSITSENLRANGVRRALYENISILLLVQKALSEALSQINVAFLRASYTEMETIRDEIVNLLGAKDVKACEFIWTTLEATNTHILELTEDMTATITPQGSSDIHKVTWSAMDHITFLMDNHLTLVSIIPRAKGRIVWFDNYNYVYDYYYGYRYGPDTLDSIIMKMASSVEEKLVSLSKSFSDGGLGFLFLLNNLYFMREELQDSQLNDFSLDLICKVNEYMKSYLDVSWAPVLSCLLDPTPLCFHKNYSSLSSEFQKTYTNHKMWKVPNPKLRKSLRMAITEKIVPRYTRYIEDNNVTTAKFGPRELEEMVQDLFEG